jgi:hypothetical protein
MENSSSVYEKLIEENISLEPLLKTVKRQYIHVYSLIEILRSFNYVLSCEQHLAYFDLD